MMVFCGSYWLIDKRGNILLYAPFLFLRLFFDVYINSPKFQNQEGPTPQATNPSTLKAFPKSGIHNPTTRTEHHPPNRHKREKNEHKIRRTRGNRIFLRAKMKSYATWIVDMISIIQIIT